MAEVIHHGPCWVAVLGRVPYDEALGLQQRIHQARVDGAGPDCLLLLEHPPTITLGRGAHAENLLSAPERLARAGIAVHEVGRGGDVTYHGPGQLVGYPIIDLTAYRGALSRYLRDLEQVLIDALAELGIGAERVEGLTGVFVGGAKIAAIGVQVKRWVSLHGFALNVSTDLSAFSHIVPCGIRDRRVTSLAEHLSAPPSLSEVGRTVASAFATVFGCDIESPGASALWPAHPLIQWLAARDERRTLGQTHPSEGGCHPW